MKAITGMDRMLGIRSVVTAGAVTAVMLLGVSASAKTIRILAELNDPTSPGERFVGFFGAPALGNNGVAFGSAAVGSSSVTFQQALYTAQIDSGITSVLIERRGGDPTGSGRNFSFFHDSNGPSRLAINDSGQVAFNAASAAPGLSPARGVYVHNLSPRATLEVVNTGTPAPGGGEFGPNFFWRPALNDAGQVAFATSLFGSGVDASNDTGIYRDDDLLGLTQIAREGQSLGGASALGAVGGRLDAPSLNESGTVAFYGGITGRGIFGDEGIFVGNGGTPTPVVRINDPLFGGATAGDITTTSPPINDAGQVAFVSWLNDGPNQSLPQGLFLSGPNATPSLLVGWDALAPDGVNQFRTIFPELNLNDSGEVLFRANLSEFAPNNGPAALFLGGSNGIQQIATQGDPMPFGATISSLDTKAALNQFGEVAFTALLDIDESDGIGSSDEKGLYFFDGEFVREVLRTGDPFEGDTLAELEFLGTSRSTGYVSPERDGLNNAGEIAFYYTLDDGRSGIGLWTATALTGDFDGSSSVEQGDLDLVLTGWGRPRGRWSNSGNFATATVDQEELDAVLTNWGSSAAPSFVSNPTLVPEPAIGAALAAGLGGVGRQRRFPARP